MLSHFEMQVLSLKKLSLGLKSNGRKLAVNPVFSWTEQTCTINSPCLLLPAQWLSLTWKQTFPSKKDDVYEVQPSLALVIRDTWISLCGCWAGWDPQPCQVMLTQCPSLGSASTSGHWDPTQTPPGTAPALPWLLCQVNLSHTPLGRPWAQFPWVLWAAVTPCMRCSLSPPKHSALCPYL